MISRTKDIFDLMDNIWSRANNNVYWTEKSNIYDNSSSFLPKVDVYSNNKSYLLRVECPGLSKSEVSIKCDGGLLVISGEKKFNTPDEFTTKRRECGYGSFVRNFELPSDITSNDINAKMENGLLEITITKPEAKKPKSTDIKIT